MSAPASNAGRRRGRRVATEAAARLRLPARFAPSPLPAGRCGDSPRVGVTSSALRAAVVAHARFVQPSITVRTGTSGRPCPHRRPSRVARGDRRVPSLTVYVGCRPPLAIVNEYPPSLTLSGVLPLAEDAGVRPRGAPCRPWLVNCWLALETCDRRHTLSGPAYSSRAAVPFVGHHPGASTRSAVAIWPRSTPWAREHSAR